MIGMPRFLFPAVKIVGWLALSVLAPVAVAAVIGAAIESGQEPWSERHEILQHEFRRVDETLREDAALRRQSRRLLDAVELRRAQRARALASRSLLVALAEFPEAVAVTRVDWRAEATTLEGIATTGLALDVLLARLHQDFDGTVRLESVTSVSAAGRAQGGVPAEAIVDEHPRWFRLTWLPSRAVKSDAGEG
ncbi:MAG: hypothetical protein AAF458_02115 [Pseudomonadota bacterium]